MAGRREERKANRPLPKMAAGVEYTADLIADLILDFRAQGYADTELKPKKDGPMASKLADLLGVDVDDMGVVWRIHAPAKRSS